LHDVVRENRVGGAEPVRAAGHEVVAYIVEERVERDFTAVRPVVARERSPVGDLSVTVSDINAGGGLEIVAKDLVAVAENSHAAAIAEVVAVYAALVAVPQAEFAARRIDYRVVAICVRARFVGDHLVLTSTADEEVVFDQAVAVRKAQAAQTEADGFGAVAAWACETPGFRRPMTQMRVSPRVWSQSFPASTSASMLIWTQKSP
jgi:hypothetical protein